MTDNVNHPSHYADKEIEVIDYIRDTLGADEFVGYCLGNVLKYTSRWRKKGGVEDLEKAKVYLEWGIQKQNEIEGYTGTYPWGKDTNSDEVKITRYPCSYNSDTDGDEISAFKYQGYAPFCRFEHGKFFNECKVRQEKGCQDCNWYLTDKEAEARGL